MPIAIVAIIVALLLLCLLVACGCAAFAIMVRSDRETNEYTVPAPPPVVTVVPQQIGGGATITYVEPGSPADSAGLQRGDVILAVDSAPIDANHDLVDVIGAYRPGDTVTIEYRQWRTGQTDTATVQLGQNPNDSTKPYLGIEYSATPFLGDGSGD